MTGHYIIAPIEKPQEWKLKSEQLSFTHIEGNHSGANLGNILIRSLDRYGIRRKVGIFRFKILFIVPHNLISDWLVYG
jgi:hypothetical protein